MSVEEAVSDLSSVKSGFIADLVFGGKITKRVILPDLVLECIRKDSEKGDIIGLDELIKLKAAADQVGIEIKLMTAKKRNDDPDEVALELAYDGGYALATSNESLAKAAHAIGIQVLKGKTKLTSPPAFLKYFTKDTMSIHLKDGTRPRAKIGRPGSWQLVEISKEEIPKAEIDRIVQDILERAEGGEGFLEVKREGSNIVMLNDSRIIITFPPFSDKLELTITRKIADLELEDYNLQEVLIERLKGRAEGILIAGAPGMGKTTFAQALAKFYLRQSKIVKTIESPRDLHLPAIATQYSKTRSSSEELHDVLLLSRPDYTFFDEMRDTDDFKIFTDLRLAGVGMVGVIHATAPIDSIQRFLGRVELGVIPSVIDTVIFIDKGSVEKVYELETTVKIPHGLTESDLTRPVVQVKNFETGDVEYEIYVFGERTFVVPMRQREGGRARAPAAFSPISRIIGKFVEMDDVEVITKDREITIMIPPESMGLVIKRCRKKLQRLEEKLRVKIILKPKV